MTRNNIVLENLVELINEHGGVEAFSQAMSTLMNLAMEIERSDALGAEPYERSDDRRGYANGFKPKSLHTRLGDVPVMCNRTRTSASPEPGCGVGTSSILNVPGAVNTARFILVFLYATIIQSIR